MYKKTHPLFLICETPLHAGSGDDLGVVDLPIQRERHTSYPKIESSSLKGALREAFEEKTKPQNGKRFGNWNDADTKVQRIFGFDDGSLDINTKSELKEHFRYTERVQGKDEKRDGNEFAGCLALTDARILLFPVKSMKGVFVWITSLQVLNRFESDLKIAGSNSFPSLSAVTNLDPIEEKAYVSNKSRVAFGDNVLLEEFAFEAVPHDAISKFATELAATLFKGDDLRYWRESLTNSLVILGNNDFRDFVNMSTEVVTRTKIDNRTGTVEEGALFTEEYLPTDSVMYNLCVFSGEFTKHADKMSDSAVEAFFTENLPPIFQLGGNATIGKGLLRTRLL